MWYDTNFRNNSNKYQTGGTYPQMLQVIDLLSISHEECYQLWEKKSVGEGHMCTYNKRGEGACYVCLKQRVNSESI